MSDIDLVDYQRRATAHRPVGLDGQRLAAHELARQGLRELDIAAALGISVEAVRQLIKVNQCHE